MSISSLKNHLSHSISSLNFNFGVYRVKKKASTILFLVEPQAYFPFQNFAGIIPYFLIQIGLSNI
jgi:hypothetical protein